MASRTPSQFGYGWGASKRFAVANGMPKNVAGPSAEIVPSTEPAGQ